MKCLAYIEKNHSVYRYAVDVHWQYVHHVGNMGEWLHEKCVEYYRSHSVFYFKKESDRTLFLLKYANAESIDRQ